jgi:hypothetical protein
VQRWPVQVLQSLQILDSGPVAPDEVQQLPGSFRRNRPIFYFLPNFILLACALRTTFRPSAPTAICRIPELLAGTEITVKNKKATTYKINSTGVPTELQIDPADLAKFIAPSSSSTRFQQGTAATFTFDSSSPFAPTSSGRTRPSISRNGGTVNWMAIRACSSIKRFQNPTINL